MPKTQNISPNQLLMVNLEMLVDQSHQYRKLKALFCFKGTNEKLSTLESKHENSYHKGYGTERLFKCLLLQFMEDMSDRELEAYLRDNAAAKWFCDFSIMDQTPTYTLFTKIRSKIGTKLLSEVFQDFKDQLASKGYMSEVFTFVDASHLISKANLWQERDKARALKIEKLNNDSLSKVAHDKQARIGAKSSNKFWYGYKKSVSVDIQSGMINKVAITPANVPDSKCFKNVMPSRGAVYADKGYCTSNVQNISKSRDVHLCAIKKSNMKDKNKDQDSYYTKIRSPFERVFSQDNKRARYISVSKNQFSALMHAICFNLKRLCVLEEMIDASSAP